MASFNVLGNSHTGPGGHHAWLASGPQRIGGVLALLSAHDISVVGMQEFQPNQRGAFQARAGGWAMYPGLSMGRRAGENSVAWREDTWEMVRPGLIPIPYFNGRIRPMPYVLLRHKATGVQAYFSTFHNPANIGGNMQRFRSEATRRQVGLFNRLEGTGIPQFVTGDMNERARVLLPGHRLDPARRACRREQQRRLPTAEASPDRLDLRQPRGAVQRVPDRPQPAGASYVGPPAPGHQGDHRRAEVPERLRTLRRLASRQGSLSEPDGACAPRRGSPRNAARAGASRVRRSRRGPC